MLNQITGTAVTFLVSSSLGYLLSSIKEKKKRIDNNKSEKVEICEALKYLIQSNLTNTYFAYQQFGEIPDYVYKNWINMFHIYKILGGNEFVDCLSEKMAKWEITRTDILNKE